MIDFDTVGDLESMARIAYANNDQMLAGAIAALIDARKQIYTLENQLSDIETLEDWEKRNGTADNYRDFFNECFARLDGHYPAPSVTSDYDKSVIFEAIEKGCNDQPLKTLQFIAKIRESKVLQNLSDSELLGECIALAYNQCDGVTE